MNTKQQLDDIQKAIDAIRVNLGLNRSEKPNSCEPDYTHLLPEGYEFCAEQDAETWVKVKFYRPGGDAEYELGKVTSKNQYIGTWKPIRPIAYHIAVHETVTAEPDPYQVDWEKAPGGAVGHYYASNGFGSWIITGAFDNFCGESGYVLQLSGLDWKKSLRVNPKLK